MLRQRGFTVRGAEVGRAWCDWDWRAGAGVTESEKAFGKREGGLEPMGGNRLWRALRHTWNIGLHAMEIASKGLGGMADTCEWGGGLPRSGSEDARRQGLHCIWRLMFGQGGVENSGSQKSPTDYQSMVLLFHPDPKGVSGVSWGV